MYKLGVYMTYKRKEIIGDCNLLGFPDRDADLYQIQDKVTKEVVYIGSTVNIKQRVNTHIRNAKSGSLLPIHEWMVEKNFLFDVVFIKRVSEADRVATESELISKHKNLLNMTDGGKGMSGNKFAGTDHAQKIANAIKSGGSFNCLKCGNTFYRKRTEILKGNNKYCTRLCSNRRNKSD